MLTVNELTLIGITVVALFFIVTDRLRPDLVALFVLLSLAFTGLVTTTEALSGFGSPAVITLMGLFVITHTLERTGVIHRVANRLNRIGRGSEPRLILMFMVTGALLSMVMNNVAAGAVLLPAAVRVGRDSGVRLSKLLIPLSFGTLAGGMATYLTTANIIMGSLLEDRGLIGLGMRDFIPTGGLIVIVSLVYMLVIGRNLLPERESISESVRPAVNLYETYELAQRLWEVQIPADSWLVHKPIRESGIGEKLGLSVVGLWRGHRAILSPGPDQIVEPGDFLLVMGREERVEKLVEWGAAFREGRYEANGDHDYTVELTEVIIPPRSGAIGKSLVELDFRRRFGLTAVALWREGRSYRTDVGKFDLQVGDAVLMVGPSTRIAELTRETDYLVLTSDHEHQAINPQKAGWALAITAAVLIIAVLDLLPLATVALAGAAAVIVTGCLRMEEAYDAIDWRVIFLIAGMLPISIGLVNTGLAGRIGLSMVENLGQFGVLPLAAGLFVLTVLVAQVIGGQVTALVMGPIAISAVLQVDVSSAQAVAVAVAIGCSTAFLTPIAHPVNLLMMGPGGYASADFLRVGLGMTLVVFITLLLGLVLFWGI
jgi:di/tricarboxylate transporter